MEKDLVDYIADLEPLQDLQAQWNKAHDSLVESALSADAIDRDIFPPEQLDVVLQADKKSFSRIFPRTPVIRDRIGFRDYALNFRKMESLLQLWKLEVDLRSFDPSKEATALDMAQVDEVLRIAQVYNKIIEFKRLSPVAPEHHQVKGDPHLDNAVLSAKFNALIDRVQNRDKDKVILTDEALILDDMHEARLHYAALHVEQAKMVLEQAQAILLQRARLILAVNENQLSPADPRASNGEDLMDFSVELGSFASGIINKLGKYYQTMQTSGVQAGQFFITNRFVPMKVNFKPMEINFNPGQIPS